MLNIDKKMFVCQKGNQSRWYMQNMFLKDVARGVDKVSEKELYLVKKLREQNKIHVTYCCNSFRYTCKDSWSKGMYEYLMFM